MKKIVLISLLCLFAIPRSIAMEEEKENVPMIESTESQKSDTAQKVAWYTKAFNYVRNNKAKTAVVSALIITTGGGFASDIGTLALAPSSHSTYLIALPGNGTLSRDTEDCFYRRRTDCHLNLPLDNFEQCEEYLDESGEFYLQSCFRENKWHKTGTGYSAISMWTRGFMLAAAIAGYRKIWKCLPWKK